MNVTNGFTSMEQIRHRMQTTDSQRQVKKQTVQTNTASFDEILFSKHASKRLETRQIDMSADQKERLLEATCKAKAKGMKKSRIMLFHCMRNIMPAYLSIMAISVAHIMGGTYVVETVFSYPGIGTLAYESARYKDYNLLMVVSLLSGIIVIVCNMAAQIINERIDPRIRISRQPDMQEVREYE